MGETDEGLDRGARWGGRKGRKGERGAAAYGDGVGAEELHGAVDELVPRIEVHHLCFGGGGDSDGGGAGRKS
jgi:hypothetical protein